MNPIRCLITDVPQRMLGDIVNKVVEKEGSLELVGNVSYVADLSEMIESQAVDVLITGVEGNDIQNLYQRLIKKHHADLLVLALVDDGRSALVYLDNIGVDEMLNLISTYARR